MAEAGMVQSLIAPRRYIQGRGVLGSLGRHVAEIGRQPLVIADENVWKLAGDRLAAVVPGRRGRAQA
jgi:glycerol dehydrogenase